MAFTFNIPFITKKEKPQTTTITEIPQETSSTTFSKDEFLADAVPEAAEQISRQKEVFGVDPAKPVLNRGGGSTEDLPMTTRDNPTPIIIRTPIPQDISIGTTRPVLTGGTDSGNLLMSITPSTQGTSFSDSIATGFNTIGNQLFLDAGIRSSRSTQIPIVVYEDELTPIKKEKKPLTFWEAQSQVAKDQRRDYGLFFNTLIDKRTKDFDLKKQPKQDALQTELEIHMTQGKSPSVKDTFTKEVVGDFGRTIKFGKNVAKNYAQEYIHPLKTTKSVTKDVYKTAAMNVAFGVGAVKLGYGGAKSLVTKSPLTNVKIVGAGIGTAIVAAPVIAVALPDLVRSGIRKIEEEPTSAAAIIGTEILFAKGIGKAYQFGKGKAVSKFGKKKPPKIIKKADVIKHNQEIMDTKRRIDTGFGESTILNSAGKRESIRIVETLKDQTILDIKKGTDIGILQQGKKTRYVVKSKLDVGSVGRSVDLTFNYRGGRVTSQRVLVSDKATRFSYSLKPASLGRNIKGVPIQGLKLDKVFYNSVKITKKTSEKVKGVDTMVTVFKGDVFQIGEGYKIGKGTKGGNILGQAEFKKLVKMNGIPEFKYTKPKKISQFEGTQRSQVIGKKSEKLIGKGEKITSTFTKELTYEKINIQNIGKVLDSKDPLKVSKSIGINTGETSPYKRSKDIIDEIKLVKSLDSSMKTIITKDGKVFRQFSKGKGASISINKQDVFNPIRSGSQAGFLDEAISIPKPLNILKGTTTSISPTVIGGGTLTGTYLGASSGGLITDGGMQIEGGGIKGGGSTIPPSPILKTYTDLEDYTGKGERFTDKFGNLYGLPDGRQIYLVKQTIISGDGQKVIPRPKPLIHHDEYVFDQTVPQPSIPPIPPINPRVPFSPTRTPKFFMPPIPAFGGRTIPVGLGFNLFRGFQRTPSFGAVYKFGTFGLKTSKVSPVLEMTGLFERPFTKSMILAPLKVKKRRKRRKA